MVTCPTCGTILFIDMDGIAHRGTEAEPEAAPVSPPAAEPIASPDAFGGFSSDLFPFDPVQPEPVPGAQPEAIHAAEMGGDNDFGNFPDPAAENSPAMPLAMPEAQATDYLASSNVGTPDEFSMDSLLGYGDPSASPSEAADGSNSLGLQSSEIGPANDPLGISSYANSEISLAKDGPFVFHIHLSGIDTKEIRAALKDSMEDSRFAWNVAQLMGKISKGDLTLENIPPVKAAILINRIKRLPIDIRWEQVPITQLDAE
jgi:hypothetical protein